jgi:hypothetical protein
MWYREAINLSNLQGFSPVETSVISKGSGIGSIPDKLVSNLQGAEEKVDEIYNFGGMDPESEQFQKFSNEVLNLAKALLPLLNSIVAFFEKQTILKFFLTGQFRLGSIIGDIYFLISVCKELENIEDDKVRVKRFADKLRGFGGTQGILSHLVSVFNSVSTILGNLLHLNISSPIDFSTVFMSTALAEYFFEESRDDEHKSGVNLGKGRLVTPTIEFLIKKNPDNRVIASYVERYIKQNPDKTHEEVRAHVLNYFIFSKREPFRNNKKFRRLPGDYNFKDIEDIVDIIYVDPQDVMPVLGGKRISKFYYDRFEMLMNNAVFMQTKLYKASFMLSKLVIMLPHL